MAALPALIASATIAYTIIFPNDNNKSKDEVLVASTRSTSYPSSPGCFLLGLSVGMTMSWLMSYEVKRRRLWETVRLKFLSWIYNGTSAANDNTISQLEQTSSRLVDKFRTPTLLSTLQGAPISQSDIEVGLSNRGESLNILSPDWTVSSGLHVNVLTLPSGTELVASTANGMEFYYVIKGNGTFHRNGEDFAVLVGYGWISDPSSVRGFKAHGRNGLVILRVTDTATHDEQNMARIERNSLSSTISLLSAGVNKIQQLLEASNQAALQRAYSGSLENLSNLDQ